MPPPSPPPRDLRALNPPRDHITEDDRRATRREVTVTQFGELTEAQQELSTAHDSLVQGQRQILDSNHMLLDRMSDQDDSIEVNKQAIASIASVVRTLEKDVQANTQVTQSIKADTEGLITLIKDAKGAGRIISIISSVLVKIGIPGGSVYALVAWATKYFHHN